MRRTITRFRRDERGAVLIEYALLTAALGIGILSVVTGLTETLGETYSGILLGLASIGIAG